LFKNIPIYIICETMTFETDVTQVIMVRAKHNFNGRNNDEKGDVIVVTQILDEGWWEGTLNDKTGWFPSNYVTVEKQESAQQNRIFVDNAIDSNRAQESRHLFRDMPMHMLGDFTSAVTAYSVFGKSWEGDCCLVLFPQVLLALQVSPELNGYTYKAEPGRYMIEIRSKVDDKTVLSFTMSNPDDLSKWLDRFETLVNDGGDDVLISPIVPSSYVNVEEEVSPLMKPKLSNMPSPGHAELFRKPVDPGKSLPPKQYSGYCLRPLPTQLRTGAQAAKDTEIKLRKKGSAAPAAAEVVYDSDEIELLKVVEMFCGGDSLKPVVESKNVKNPGILIAEDEKIFFEEFVGDELVVHEKTLVDTVYALKDQVRILSEIVNDLTKTAQSEQSARRRTDELMCQLMNERTSNSSTLSNYTKDWPTGDGTA
ncbi:Rho guanine nucleotide exchange factor 7, partial [Trichinella nelsoni]